MSMICGSGSTAMSAARNASIAMESLPQKRGKQQ